MRGEARLILVMLAALALPTAAAQQAGRRAFTSRAFPHAPHLKDATDAECLRCHAQESEGIAVAERTLTSFENCAHCHAREKSIELSTAPKKEVVPFSRFSHAAHRIAKCATCHEWDRAKDVFSTPRDMKVCAGCHGLHDTAKAEFSGSCASCHFQRVLAPLAAERKGAFLHSRHLPEGRAPVREDCARCHDAAASTDLRDGKLLGARAEKCAACHKPETSAPAPRVAAESRPEKRFFTEFDHATHAASLDCMKCHELKGDTFRMAGALPKYQGCVDCHYHAQWKVREHGKPIQCGRCHEANGPAIRVVEVEKQDWGTVAFAGVRHPFLAPGELDKEQQACAVCHLRAREAVPSRVSGRRFSHAEHLGKDAALAATRGRFPLRERCLACHHALERSSTPATSKTFDTGEDCAQCHRGGPLEVARTARTVRLPPFSHESHLAAKNARIAGCESCHEYDGPKDAMVTAADVAACTRCHDHREKADVTGRDLEKCILCHKGESLFRQGVTVDVPSVRLAGAAFSHQFHDQGGKCAACHAPAGGFAIERPTVAEVRHKNDPHVGLTMDSCKDCHVRPKGF